MYINPFPPMSVKWHLQILLCLTPADFSRQWGTTYRVERVNNTESQKLCPVNVLHIKNENC